MRTRGGGVFSRGRPHFLVQKNYGFLKFMVVRTDKGGKGKQIRTFCKQEGVNFSQFWANVFYGLRCLNRTYEHILPAKYLQKADLNFLLFLEVVVLAGFFNF